MVNVLYFCVLASGVGGDDVDAITSDEPESNALTTGKKAHTVSHTLVHPDEFLRTKTRTHTQPNSEKSNNNMFAVVVWQNMIKKYYKIRCCVALVISVESCA